MRLYHLVFAFCCAALSAFPAGPPALADVVTQPQPTEAADADVDAITAAHRTFWRAYGAGDLWELSHLWDRDDETISAIFPASSKPAMSWSDISESFRQTFSHNRNVKIDEKVIRVVQQGDVAWVLGSVRYEAVQTQTGQYILMDRMLTTEIYRRRNGVWLLAHYHGYYPGFLPPEDDPSQMIPTIVRPQHPEGTVEGFHERFMAAFSSLDVGEMFPLLSTEEDSSAMHPRSPIAFLGPENVIAAWKNTFDEVEAITIEPIRTVITESETTAWIVEFSQYHMILKSQPDIIHHWHNVLTTFILRKEFGEWQIVHYQAHLGFEFGDHH